MILGIIGQSLLEAAAQTFVGAVAGYTFDKIKNNMVLVRKWGDGFLKSRL